MHRFGERTDIGAGAKHVVFAGADDDGAHLGVLEAQALHGVGELDIDTEIVRIELQFGARVEAASRIDIEGQGRDRAVDRQFPVAITRWVGAEIDGCHRDAALLRFPAQAGIHRPTVSGAEKWGPASAGEREKKVIIRLLTPQLVALDFAGRGFWQRFDKFDPARVFPYADAVLD